MKVKIYISTKDVFPKKIRLFCSDENQGYDFNVQL